jgi:Fic family protein
MSASASEADPETGKRSRVVPGEFRKEHVAVGDHIAPAPGELESLFERALAGYRDVAPLRRCVAVAASHHRLLWIHPFLDGSPWRAGRVW